MNSVRYARTTDGVDIAYATVGDGPPLMVARPILRLSVDYLLEESLDPELPKLARRRSVVIWDPRGFGLSETSEPCYTVDTSLLDMGAVMDALALESSDILACMTPAHTAIAFAARFPERVRRLALWNPAQPGSSPRTTGLAHLPDISATHFREYVELGALKFFGWDNPEPAKRWMNTLLRQFNGQTWLRMMETMEAVDATDEAKNVRCPTLVLIDPNAMDRHQARRTEFMRRLAATIPDGQLAILRPNGPGYAEIIEGFLSSGDDRPPPSHLASGTAIIFFADIADSTALTERLGDAAFRAKARDLDGALRTVIRENAGTAIEGKLLGDGVLAVFTSARQAIEAALACGAAGSDAGLPLHLGLHAGDVIREENNVYGGAVNIAARISGLSAPGEVLVSETVRVWAVRAVEA